MDAFKLVLSSVEQLFRYLAPGAVAVIVAGLCQTGGLGSYIGYVQKNGETILALAAVTGVFLSAVHQNLVSRLFLWRLILILCRKRDSERWNTMLGVAGLSTVASLGQVMECLDQQRWLRRRNEQSPASGIQRELDMWAGMIKFLYSSSYAMIAIPWMPSWTCSSPCISSLGVVLLIGACLSDYRLSLRELWATNEYPQPSSRAVSSSNDL